MPLIDVNEIGSALSCQIQQYNDFISYKYSINYAKTNEITQMVKEFH